MRKIVVLFLLSVIACCVHATLQEPDCLIYKGHTFLLREGSAPRPLKKGTNVIHVSDVCTTATARGYVATWEIRNDSLFLVKLQDGLMKEIPLHQYYDDRDTSNGVFADWHSHPLLALNGVWLFAFFVQVKSGIVQPDTWMGMKEFPDDLSGNWCYSDSTASFSVRLQKVGKTGYKGLYTLFRKAGMELYGGKHEVHFSESIYFEVLRPRLEFLPGSRMQFDFYDFRKDSLRFRCFGSDSLQGFPEKGVMRRGK